MKRSDRPLDDADDPVLTALWSAHRRRMLGLAFRILLDFGDAEDVVQEAFSRLARSDLHRIDDTEGWLIVVVTRLCIDKLRTRQRRPADSIDAGDVPDADVLEPPNRVTLADNVTMAMHDVLERLSPGQRTSFVLRDVFQYSFEEIGAIVGRRPEACRQLASRARRTLRAESSSGRFPVDYALHRRVSRQFINACAGGDLQGLLALLDPKVEGAHDTSPEVLVGAADVAAGILRFLGSSSPSAPGRPPRRWSSPPVPLAPRPAGTAPSETWPASALRSERCCPCRRRPSSTFPTRHRRHPWRPGSPPPWVAPVPDHRDGVPVDNRTGPLPRRRDMGAGRRPPTPGLVPALRR